MPDEDLIYWLGRFTDMTRKIISSQTDFTPMVFLVTGDEIANLGFMGDEEHTAWEGVPLYFGFGRALSQEYGNPEPDFVVVAELLQHSDGSLIVMVHGCAADGSQGHDGFFVKRNWRKRLKPTEEEASDWDEQYNLAAEVLRGIRAGPDPATPD